MVDKSSPDFVGLTDREIECLDGMLVHYSGLKVAIALKLSRKTVQTYLERAKFKAYPADTDVATLQLCLDYDRWKREQRSIELRAGFIP